jgi:hypothetical protein
MRFNAEIPDWIYLGFRNKVGTGNMTNVIQNIMLNLITTGKNQDLIEMKANLELLNQRKIDAQQSFGFVEIQYKEAQQTLESANRDILTLETLIKEKEAKLQKEIEEHERIEDEIKFNTMKDRMSDM